MQLNHFWFVRFLITSTEFLDATMVRSAHCSSSRSHENRSCHSASRSACWFRAQLAGHFPKIGNWQMEKDSELMGSSRHSMSSKHTILYVIYAYITHMYISYIYIYIYCKGCMHE